MERVNSDFNTYSLYVKLISRKHIPPRGGKKKLHSAYKVATFVIVTSQVIRLFDIDSKFRHDDVGLVAFPLNTDISKDYKI
jgi:hypothetical protein